MNFFKILAQQFDLTEMQPFGIKISPKQQGMLTDLDAGIIKELANQYKIVLLRGFDFIDKETLVNYAKSVGSLLEWDFGSVMEMKAQEEPKNYLFTNGAVPFHWDGAFHQSPHLLLFHCIEASLMNAGGETTFCNTETIWQDASPQDQALWQQVTMTYKTEKLAHYGGNISVPLVQQHPYTKKTVLRFAEPVVAVLNPVEAQAIGVENSNDFMRTMAARCYNPQNLYQHQWQNNDFLIADNHALIHGRRAFQQFSPRHLRRIQIL